MWSIIVRNQVFRWKTSQHIARHYSDGPPPKLLRKYEHFQKDDGVPVYIKGGAGDKALFGLTLVGIAVGLSDGMYTLITMAMPKKKK